MNKKLIFFSLLLIILVAFGIFMSNQNQPKNNLKTALTEQKKVITPSNTLKEYTDTAGFSFNYPDNLSIQNSEIIDKDTYADLQLFSKDISGSLNLKITDSKYASLDDWLKTFKLAAKDSPKELKFGNLKAIQFKTADRLYLGALDQGVLFTVEMPLIEQDFWAKVYDKLLADFSFTPATSASGTTDPSDVAFEGEEVIE